MGGRTYNPVLGRFMQADPFIQQASNLQSFNRYSYVLNNPMSYTDPSGYFFKALNKLFGKFAPLVSIAIAVYLPGMNFLQGLSSVQVGAITGFVSGGVATGSLRGALTGALSGAAFGSLHNWKSNLVAKGIDYGRIAAHGIVGGISSELSGGKFGHGFAAAGFTQAASEIGGEGLFIEGAESLPDRASNAIKAAIIGGSASVLSGGKFGNGAITGAFSRLLNDDALQNVNPDDRNYPFSKNAEETMASPMASDTELLKESSLGKYRVAIGRDGEAHVWSELFNRGYEVFPDGVSIDYQGSYRIYDGAYRKPGGEWTLIEVKTNTSPLIKRQVIIDRGVTTRGVTGINNAPAGFQIGKPYTVQLFRVTIISGK